MLLAINFSSHIFRFVNKWVLWNFNVVIFDLFVLFRDAREFLEALAVGNHSAEDHEMSLLFVLWYLRQAQGVNRIWCIKDGAQERKIIGGSQQLSTKIAEKLGGTYS